MIIYFELVLIIIYCKVLIVGLIVIGKCFLFLDWCLYKIWNNKFIFNVFCILKYDINMIYNFYVF